MLENEKYSPDRAREATHLTPTLCWDRRVQLIIISGEPISTGGKPLVLPIFYGGRTND